MGTDAGNNKATGHKAKITSAYRASGANQLARNRLHRLINPKRSKVQAAVAPNSAPKVFNNQSRLEGTLAGKKS
jgi:hypothetical protein